MDQPFDPATAKAPSALAAWMVQKALLSSYSPKKVLDAIATVPLEFRLASEESTRRVRNEYNRLRPGVIAAAREEALELWGAYAPKDMILKAIMAGGYDVHHKHLVSLGGGNDTLIYLPGDVHTELHRRHNAITNQVRKLVAENMRGTRAQPLTVEKKLEKISEEGIPPSLLKKLAGIKGVMIDGSKIMVDTPWPEGKILIPQLLPFEPAHRAASPLQQLSAG